MRYVKWLGVAAGLLLLWACWVPWVAIHSKDIIITGMQAAGTNYGKPGLLHLILIPFFIVFSLIPRLWAKRFNLLVTGLNTAWMLRNFFLLSLCRGGECPERLPGIYWVLLSSLLMLAAALSTELPRTVKEKNN